MNKKYIIALDGYTMTGRDGYNSNTYVIKEDKVSQLKEEDSINIVNLENFIGGNEAVNYDLIEFNEDMNILNMNMRVVGNDVNITVSYDKERNTEEEIKKLISDKFLNDFSDECKITITTSEIDIRNELSEYIGTIDENDFAYRFFKDEKDIEIMKGYLKN